MNTKPITVRLPVYLIEAIDRRVARERDAYRKDRYAIGVKSGRREWGRRGPCTRTTIITDAIRDALRSKG